MSAPEHQNLELTVFKNSVSADMHRNILSRLRAVEADNDVRILFAVESGSRAWGFPSPDSDYDVRFVYAHQMDWYLSLTPGRDVIELPLEGDYDINGWDIKKALSLLLKPNPVILEWLSSPIRYIWHDDSCAMLSQLALDIAEGNNSAACLHHYLNLGARQYETYVKDKTQVKIKKYFYIVRPALAVRWIRLYPQTFPPMNFQELVKGCKLDSDLKSALKDLLVAKSKSKEVGLSQRIDIIDAFIADEFAQGRALAANLSAYKSDHKPAANRLFRNFIKTPFT